MNTYLPGTACLLEELDKKILVILRDGRTIIGYLRSIDQYANLVLNRTLERIHVGKKYGDLLMGVYVIRGENVVLLGEIDSEKELRAGLIKVTVEEIMQLQKEEQLVIQQAEDLKKKAIRERGGIYCHVDPLQEDFC